ncbi:hypothetical protein IF2G_05629 [Cordyceps javanica]|nr:hypothetical protein IF2G_05629 [Cordyceps javanica]
MAVQWLCLPASRISAASVSGSGYKALPMQSRIRFQAIRLVSSWRLSRVRALQRLRLAADLASDYHVLAAFALRMIQRVHDVTLPSQPPRAKVCTFCIIYSHESEKKKELIQQRQTRITLCMAGGSSTCLNVPLKREQVTEQWGRAPESVVGRHASAAFATYVFNNRKIKSCVFFCFSKTPSFLALDTRQERSSGGEQTWSTTRRIRSRISNTDTGSRGRGSLSSGGAHTTSGKTYWSVSVRCTIKHLATDFEK